MNTRAHVLIIDDDATFCRLLAEILESAGARTDWTSDGREGYRLALRDPYDLYILDVRMPPVDGMEIAEQLKSHNPGTRIILISAFADASLLQRSQRLGIPLLSKPFSTAQLLEQIRNLPDSSEA